MGDPGAGGRSPGWYRDPDDPTRLHYWRGTWTGRHRARPAWELYSEDWKPPDGDDPDAHVLEGPVRAAELPAIATAVSHGRDTKRPAPPSLTGRRRTGDQPPLAARDAHHRPGHPIHRSPAWPGQRRAMMIVCVVAVMAVLAMLVAVGMVRRPVYNGWVLGDQAFISQADAACASALPSLRQQGVQTMTSSTPTPPSATTVAADARGIDALAGGLATIPLRGVDRVHVRDWLSDWHAYSADELAYATYLGQPPAAATPGKASTLAADAATAAGRADAFAVDEGLVSCTLAPHPGDAGAQPFT
ncbi:MAG TPA: hypothetical protein VG184_01825 [Acidimicrobiales bacterium]|jgi:hypothetical protein|nr:hypothetical protein [Acidimicrobiales bacterium]